MSSTYNPLAVAKFLGPNHPTLSHTIRFLNTVRGTDKVLMFVQYFTKIIIYYLQRRAPSTPISKSSSVSNEISLVTRLQNLAGPVSDFRILLRYYGLLPLIKYMIDIEYAPPPSRLHLNIERLQNLCNVLYYPLEHVWWLAAHQVIPMAPRTADLISIWSCRFWATYVVLEFARLAEQWRLLKVREYSIHKQFKDGEYDDSEKSTNLKEIVEEKKSIFWNTLINIGYLPLTVHWSLENSGFPDIGVGIFGTLASIGQNRGAWLASS